MTIDERLAEIERRAIEDKARFVSDDIDANAETDVPRLVAALREAIQQRESWRTLEREYVGPESEDERIAAILDGSAK